MGKAEYRHSEAEYRNDTTPGVKRLGRSQIPPQRSQILQQYHAGREEIRAKPNTATEKLNTATIPCRA